MKIYIFKKKRISANDKLLYSNLIHVSPRDLDFPLAQLFGSLTLQRAGDSSADSRYTR